MQSFRLHWIPRILTLLLAGFLGVFALDVFEGPTTWLQKLTGFVIHLTPTWLLLLVLAVAWKKPQLGGLIGIGVALFFAVLFRVWLSQGNIAADLIRVGIVLLTAGIGCLFIAVGKQLPTSRDISGSRPGV